MDGQDVKDVEKKERKPLIYPRVDLRHAAYKTLVENGVDKTIAAEALGYKGKSCYEIEKRLEKKGMRIEVTSQKMIRKSVRNLEKLVDAQPFGTLETVKDSTVLAAIQTVLDRSHPKHQEITPPTYSFTKIDLDQFRTDYQPPAVPAGEAHAPVTLDVEIVPGGEGSRPHPRTGEPT
jgi:hypothetical protein